MAHMIVLAEGFKEAFARFEADMDRHSYGKGVVRLREFRLYDIQYPKEMENELKENFQLHPAHKSIGNLAFHLKQAENPVRHTRIQGLLCLAVRILGWPFGFKPATNRKGPLNPSYRPVCIDNINFYPMAVADDNTMVNKAHGREEEWL